MSDRYGAGRAKRKRDMHTQVAIADRVVMVTLQFLERAWPLSRKPLEGMPDSDPRMVKSGRGVLFALSMRVIKRVRCVGIR